MNLSTGFVKALALYGYQANLANGKLLAYSGTMPATADTAITSGTLLGTVTLSGGAWTAETRAEWKITIAGSSGSVDTITIGGMNILPSAVSFTTDLATTATAIATSINNARSMPDFEARTDDDDIYIKAPISSGTAYNDVVCATTATTMTATVASTGKPAASGGTAGVAAANGLNWSYPPVSGVLSKETTTWQDTSADATGTIGYFRLVLDSGDDGTSASTTYRRVDFSVGSSGADINGTVLTTTINTPLIINTFAFTIPSAGSAT